MTAVGGLDGGLEARRARIAQMLVLVLPNFGRWASGMRDFETPYGKAGIRQLEVLYVLRHDLLDRGKPTPTALADAFDIQRSVVTRILAKLEAAGYITRAADVSDGRAWRIAITALGRDLSDFVERQYFAEMRSAIGDIEADEVDCLERAAAILARVSADLGFPSPAGRLDAVIDR